MLHALVADSARRAGRNLAVCGPDGRLSYAELDCAANAFAADLRARGVRRGDRVVIWLGKSAGAVVAMQAVLRLAAVYVPLDMSNPARRTARIVRGCAARVVVTDAAGQGALREAGLDVPTVRINPPGPGAAPAIGEPVGPDDLAYILYTSGSTGEPKGVCISHRNALAFVRWAASMLDAHPGDRFANHAPFSFDLSVLDLYVAFLAGASVHLVPAELAYAPVQLVEFLRRERITVWYSVPSALILMMRSGGLCEQPAPPALRALLFAGEPFPMEHLSRLYRHWPGIPFHNLYGPTETNVCTFHTVTAADVDSGRPLPIGRPCSGDEAWAERDGGGRAGPGEEGELLVSGPTVMAGYWGRQPQDGPYRTGDLVRVRADGGFDYLGRRDHLVKVRGHRVELGEIEAVVAQHPGVAEAAVVMVGAGDETRLVAVVVPADDPPGLLALKRHCAERLPRYMIIDAVHLMPELPRTRNGKTDRRRLHATVGPSNVHIEPATEGLPTA
jgi:clorobiocin biosynthesis protein CloN4